MDSPNKSIFDRIEKSKAQLLFEPKQEQQLSLSYPGSSAISTTPRIEKTKAEKSDSSTTAHEILQSPVSGSGELFEANILKSVALLRTHRELKKRDKAIEDELGREKQQTIRALVGQLAKQQKNDEVVIKCIEICGQIQGEFERFKEMLAERLRKESRCLTEEKAVQCDITLLSSPSHLKCIVEPTAGDPSNKGTVQHSEVYVTEKETSLDSSVVFTIKSSADAEPTSSIQYSQTNVVQNAVIEIGAHSQSPADNEINKLHHCSEKNESSPMVAVHSHNSQIYSANKKFPADSKYLSSVTLSETNESTPGDPRQHLESDFMGNKNPAALECLPSIQAVVIPVLENSKPARLNVEPNSKISQDKSHKQTGETAIANAEQLSAPSMADKISPHVESQSSTHCTNELLLDTLVAPTFDVPNKASQDMFLDSQVSVIPESQPSSYKSVVNLESNKNFTPSVQPGRHQGITGSQHFTTIKRKVHFAPPYIVTPAKNPKHDTQNRATAGQQEKHHVVKNELCNAAVQNPTQCTSSRLNLPVILPMKDKAGSGIHPVSEKPVLFEGGKMNKVALKTIYGSTSFVSALMKIDGNKKENTESKIVPEKFNNNVDNSATPASHSGKVKAPGTVRAPYLEDLVPFDLPQVQRSNPAQYSRALFNLQEIQKIRSKQSSMTGNAEGNKRFLPPTFTSKLPKSSDFCSRHQQ